MMTGLPTDVPATRAAARERRHRWWVHNLVAHPLLVLCPPVGEWLHERTAPEGDR
jgi:hypothetical protein